MTAEQSVSFRYRVACFLGSHKWCYADARNRRCLRCSRTEERVGMSGLDEIWVKR